MSRINNSIDLLNALAEAGLPIPESCVSLQVNVECDSAPTITVESLVSDEHRIAFERVLEKYEFTLVAGADEGAGQ